MPSLGLLVGLPPDGDAMMHLLFGNLSTWLLLGVGWLILSIITSLIFGLIARYDGRKGE